MISLGTVDSFEACDYELMLDDDNEGGTASVSSLWFLQPRRFVLSFFFFLRFTVLV